MAKKASRYHKRAEEKAQKERLNRERREQFRKRQRNKRIANYAIITLLVIIAAFGIYSLVGDSEEPGQYDAFARCVTAEGAIMYGTDWCPHCQEQKRLFGSSFRLINYINCDLNAAACELAGVQGYPTWNFAQGPPLAGTQQLGILAERTGCVLE